MPHQENLNPNEPPESSEREVGIVGLGRMGRVFANLLIDGGVHVIAFDVDGDKVKAAAKNGAIPASTPQDFSRCEVVLTSLPDDDALRSVVLSEAGLASVLRPGTIHLARSDGGRGSPWLVRSGLVGPRTPCRFRGRDHRFLRRP
jgi:phosphoglycerate dehydrogenase-like enzyme